MIIIDGNKSDIQICSFPNLEEILVKVMEEDSMENRIVTDVFLNEEAFSELYPHQSEDIDSSEIQKLEIRSVSLGQMAADVTTELYKVITIMTTGARRCAGLFRSADVNSGLETLQDIIDVTRDFLGTINVLCSEFSISNDEKVQTIAKNLSNLIDEMSEIIEQEDWIILSDLIEFDFLPTCESWSSILGSLAQEIAQSKAA